VALEPTSDARHHHGRGSVIRDDVVQLDAVDYWLTEAADGPMVTTTGYIRGDSGVLGRLSRSRTELTLVLEDGRRLPFVVTQARPDGVTWCVEALGSPHRSSD
jgi:hypothetical protein